MNRLFAALFSSLVLAIVVLACSSSGSGGGGASGYTLTNCPNNPLIASSAVSCLQCAETNCGSQIATVNSACSSELACGCPSGVDAAVCPSAYQADGGATPCTTAVGIAALTPEADGGINVTAGFFGCALEHCFAQCTGSGSNGADASN